MHYKQAFVQSLTQTLLAQLDSNLVLFPALVYTQGQFASRAIASIRHGGQMSPSQILDRKSIKEYFFQYNAAISRAVAKQGGQMLPPLQFESSYGSGL